MAQFARSQKISLNETAHININEPSGSLFPYNKYYINICNNDQEPSHFHIITAGWDVEFLLDGTMFRIKTSGNNNQEYKYMIENVSEWLDKPCHILPSITNYENAVLQWTQLHLQ